MSRNDRLDTRVFPSPSPSHSHHQQTLERSQQLHSLGPEIARVVHWSRWTFATEVVVQSAGTSGVHHAWIDRSMVSERFAGIVRRGQAEDIHTHDITVAKDGGGSSFEVCSHHRRASVRCLGRLSSYSTPGPGHFRDLTRRYSSLLVW